MNFKLHSFATGSVTSVIKDRFDHKLFRIVHRYLLGVCSRWVEIERTQIGHMSVKVLSCEQVLDSVGRTDKIHNLEWSSLFHMYLGSVTRWVVQKYIRVHRKFCKVRVKATHVV